jgi:hypothetical protein
MLQEYLYLLSFYRAVSIAISYGLDDREVGVRVPVESRIFFSPRRPDQLWGLTKSPIHKVPGALSSGVKRQGRKADYSPPTCRHLLGLAVCLSNVGALTSRNPMGLHGLE